MPYDMLTAAAVRDELHERLSGGRVQKILQPSQLAVALAIYSGGVQHWLILSADAAYARVHLSSSRLAKAFATPGTFIMLLRKYLEGSRVTDVSQLPGERVLTLRFQSSEHDSRLVAEIMGKHSNVILVGEDDRILGAIKTVPPRLSRVRPIVTGGRYESPPEPLRDQRLYPEGPRVDPSVDPNEAERLLCSLPAHTPGKDALQGLLVGCSPFLAEQIVLRAGWQPRSPLAKGRADTLLAAATELYGLRAGGSWRAHTFANSRGRLDFAPYAPLGVDDIEPVSSISDAIDRSLSALESRDSLASSRNAALDRIRRARHTVERRIASLQRGLESAAAASDVMEQGQLILAYAYSLEPRASELHLPDLGMTIPLDPTLTPQKNAERLFRRYQKLRDAKQRIPALLRSAQLELDRLQDLEVFATLARSESELRDLERDAEQSHVDSRPASRARPKRGPLRFQLGDFTAVVGRNARENEDVTFRLASRRDLWLHARERTGAHVILQTAGREVEDADVEAAARLAAHFSESRTDSAVDVDVTEVKHVRKIPGAAPGRVTYRDFRTVRVQPSIDGWKQL